MTVAGAVVGHTAVRVTMEVITAVTMAAVMVVTTKVADMDTVMVVAFQARVNVFKQ